MTEKWKAIPGYEGYYEVSDEGQVRSLDRVIDHPTAGKVRRRGKVLAFSTKTHDGYLGVGLNIAGVKKKKRVHRLVLESFVGPCPEGMECRHLNGDPADNRLENLAWGTPKENSQDIKDHGRQFRLNQDKCVNGHPYEGNVRTSYKGTRQCVTCERNKQHRANEKRLRENPKNGANKSECNYGHPFNEKNTRLSGAGKNRNPKRVCRSCAAARESIRRNRLDKSEHQKISDRFYESL